MATFASPIGLIGATVDAHAMAQRLAAGGHRVLLYMLPGAPRFTPTGPAIECVATPTDIGFDARIVLMAVADTEVMRPLLIGTPERMGLGAEMLPGSVLVDLGPRPPRETQAVLGLLGTRGVAVVDAAIVGRADAIAEGRARVLLGGFPDACDQARPVLAHFGTVEATGPLGSAHTAAALMGSLEAARLIAREEAAGIARAFGLQGDVLARVLDDGPGPDMSNVIQLTRTIELAQRIAESRGLSADIIDLTRAKLARSPDRIS